MPTKSGFFVKFNDTIMDAINRVGDTYQAQYATGIMSLMVGSITLYILWVGYCTLAGKNKTPVDDVVWNLARFAMITAFVSNAGGCLTSLGEALQGLKDGFSDSVSVWATLDTLWESTQKLATDVYQADPSWAPLEGGLGMVLVWAGSMALMLVSSVVFLTADLTMKFMLITAPIFIFCLMFGFLRPMFNNWLQLIFSSILTVLFASIVIRLAIDFQADMAAQVNTVLHGEGNIVTIGAMGAVTGFLAAALVTIAAGFAQKLAGAGAEGAIQGLAIGGIMKVAKPVGKAAAKGTGKAVGDGLGKVGDKAASNLQGSSAVNPTKARAKAAVEAMKAYNASQSK